MPSPNILRFLSGLLLPALYLGGLLGLASSCYYDNEEELYQNIEDTKQCDTSEVTFQQTVDPIISTNCAVSGCHAGASPTAGLNLEDFSQLQNIANNGQLTGRTTGSSGPVMPPGNALDPCDINKIRNWVEQGAPQN